jgi:hypothetical protein
MQYRQGDVLLVSIDHIPDGVKEVKRDKLGRLVLARGEATGHAHVIHNPSVCGYSKHSPEEIEFLLVQEGGAGPLLHELDSGGKADHDEIELVERAYQLPQQVQYTPTELKRMAD